MALQSWAAIAAFVLLAGNAVAPATPHPSYWEREQIRARWRFPEIKYSVQAADPQRLAADRAITARAAAAWAPALEGALRVREVRVGEGADIYMHFAAAGDPHCEGNLGLTRTSFDGPSRTLRGAVIWLDEAKEPRVLSHAVTHEFGHALGLLEHSDDPSDVMYPYTISETGVTARDINTMAQLYSLENKKEEPNGR